ncbi:MAG: hypothetical protein V3U60_16740 [Gammaproteobacteria bacterium]
MEYDGHSRMQSLLALGIMQTQAATVDGKVIDTIDFESLEFTFHIGLYNSGNFDIQLQESDTGAFGGEENIVGADDLIGTPATLSASDDLTRIGYIGKKRYCRLTVLGTNSPDSYMTAVAILGRPRSMPVTDQ